MKAMLLSPAEILLGRVLRDGIRIKMDQNLWKHHKAVLKDQEAGKLPSTNGKVSDGSGKGKEWQFRA